MRRRRTRSLLGSVLVIDRSSRARRIGSGVGFARSTGGVQRAVRWPARRSTPKTTDGGGHMARHRIWPTIAATAVVLGGGGTVDATTPPEATPVIDPGDG